MTKKKSDEIPPEALEHFVELTKQIAIGKFFMELMAMGEPFTATFDGERFAVVMEQAQNCKEE